MRAKWPRRSFVVLACLCASTVLTQCDTGGGDGIKDVPTPTPGSMVPQFAQPLPTLSVAGGTITTLRGNQPLTIRMCEFWAHVLPPGTFRAGEQPKTRVWGYIEGESCPPNGPDDPALDTYTGPVIISERSKPPTTPRPPTTVTWVNDLGTTDTTQVLAYRESTDQTLHWADPNELECNEIGGIPAFGTPCARNYRGPIPAVVHLHGGEVPPMLDGGPEAWFLSQPAAGYRMHGPAYYSMDGDGGNHAIYAYPNVQEAAPLWFHDHTAGTTTLNVYAGLAGGYLIVDPDLELPQGLTATGLRGPNGTEEALIPLVIQDRSFDANGQLFYPGDTQGGEQLSPNPQHPYWVPEIFLDTITVNGKVWPYLDVEPKRYRFVLIEGSNSRAYALSLVRESGEAVPIWVIGTEEGYLDAPVRLDGAAEQELVMLPGERYDVIVDFSGMAAGTRLRLMNSAGSPFPDGDAPDPATTARVMQFRVGECTSGGCGASDPSYDPASGQAILRGEDVIVRFADPATGRLVPEAAVQKVRELTLNEVLLPESIATNPATGAPNTEFPGGPLVVLLNNTKWEGRSTRPYGDFAPVTLNGETIAFSELPREGDVEVWEIVNLTQDAHPIHTHLTDIQIINRQALDVGEYLAAYEAAFPGGSYIPAFGPPLDYEAGNARALGGNPDIGPFLTASPEPPAPYEAGWKDTVVAPPGQVTRFVVRLAPSVLPIDAPQAIRAYPFDPSDWLGYPWHCHITTHEDNEMMRPFQVLLNPEAPPPAERLLQLGRDY